ncbi:hypothetical protein SEA_STEPHIG9_56 [Mycobacterium phage Stephig9]|uniref:DUF6378 domain-containing protein n=1 Tax=Mycobacterium phage Stephig9 TaxID=2591224 RepID=A0A514DHC9_9CAUD|nr:hypothetical protein SEA_STEPHIG9_56 [Mycobacterium phage Stephig9]
MTESILQEAERLINGDRAATYGDASKSFWDIAERWNVELMDKLNQSLTAHDVAHMMIQLKLSRARNGFHRDSYVDIGGYAGLTERLTPEPTPDPEPPLAEWEKELLLPPEPRVWDSILYVPFGVRVVDEDRDIWSYRHEGGWGYTRRQGVWVRAKSDLTDYCGPFTEILDG